MSASVEIQDEIEALNSIYGDSTLTSTESPTSFILHLPGTNRSSLRLTIPPNYPDVPPEVDSTFSSGGASRPVAAAELRLFRQAISAVFQPGLVCLYDAVEELSSLLESEEALHEASAEEDPTQGAQNQEAHDEPEVDYASMPPPPWTLSLPITENRSTFLARIAPVSSPAQATQYVQHLLATDRKARQATHNITAWRIRGPNGTSFQDYDDDGETAAGGRLLHLMQAMDLWDVMVVVTRWFGGLKLGPRRFALINTAARDGFVRAGFVKEGDEKKKKGR